MHARLEEFLAARQAQFTPVRHPAAVTAQDVVGAFDDATVKGVMRMTAEDEPVCLVVLGTVRETAG